MKTRRRTCTHRRTTMKRRTIVLSPILLNAVRRTVGTTAARFGTQLPQDHIEDTIQDVLLNLWRSRAERMLDCLPYVRRAATNATVDLLRRQSAQKRLLHHHETFDLVRTLWYPPCTPEEILIERQEAYLLLAGNSAIRKRVRRLAGQMAKGKSLIARRETI